MDGNTTFLRDELVVSKFFLLSYIHFDMFTEVIN